jgi:hypothetical protein
VPSPYGGPWCPYRRGHYLAADLGERMGGLGWGFFYYGRESPMMGASADLSVL